MRAGACKMTDLRAALARIDARSKRLAAADRVNQVIARQRRELTLETLTKSRARTCPNSASSSP